MYNNGVKMEEIINSINQAEAQALEIKTKAQAAAAEIIANAETIAADIAKKSEYSCKAFRDDKLKLAEAEARHNYAKTIEVQSAKYKEFADEALKNVEKYAEEIAGRISGGNS